SVEKTGFSKKVLSEVVIGAEIMQSVNVPLEIGQTTQSITVEAPVAPLIDTDRKSTRLNSSHLPISYGVFCLRKKLILDELTAAAIDSDSVQLVNILFLRM